MDGSTEALSSGFSVAAASKPPPGALSLLLRVHWTQLARRIRGIGRRSPFLLALIAGFLLGYLGTAYLLFYKALRFAGSFPGIGSILIERMLYLLFAFLFALLLLSNLVISYTNLFRNAETRFLVCLPIPRRVIFQWKLIESALLASWAFLFLVAPLLVAYGSLQRVQWHYYPLTALYMGLFIILPACAGAWLAVWVARYLDRRSFQIGTLIVVGALAALAAIYWRPQPVTDQELETRVLAVLDRLLSRTEFALFPFLPSYWMAAGIQRWAEGAARAGIFFGAVLLSYVLFFGFLISTRMGKAFYTGLAAVQSRGGFLDRWQWRRRWRSGRQSRRANRRRLSVLERLLFCVPGLPGDRRALILKDIRIFWRDTAQWAQTLVLFGLLTVYFLNLRHFSRQLTNPFWISVVSFLNLGACSLNLATLTTRFVYPQFSLEGKRLWIVGLAPLGLDRVIRTKFWMSVALSLAVTVGLVLLSCRMLALPWSQTIYHLVAVAVMALTLNGLATGLGVLYPDLHEDNPSRIVSGFGGTLCLALSFLYIVGGVLTLAVGAPWSLQGLGGTKWAAFCWGMFLGFSFLLGAGPMRLASRRLARFES